MGILKGKTLKAIANWVKNIFKSTNETAWTKEERDAALSVASRSTVGVGWCYNYGDLTLVASNGVCWLCHKKHDTGHK